MHENHYAIIARLKSSYVSNYKISITLLIFHNVADMVYTNPTANLLILFIL